MLFSRLFGGFIQIHMLYTFVLLSTETGSQDKCQILEEDFHIKMTLALESEVSLMCNLSKGSHFNMKIFLQYLALVL